MGDRALRRARGSRVAPDPRPLGGLADLADLVGGDSDRSRRFLGGVIAGALVGAAVVGAAGRALVRRRELRAGGAPGIEASSPTVGAMPPATGDPTGDPGAP